LELLNFKTHPVQKALLRTVCSKGTYIRTLCADIGARLGSAAHVSFLIREAVGPFRLDKSLTLQELQEDFATPLRPLDYPLAHLPAVRITPEQAAKFCSGSALEGIPWSQQESIRVYVDEKNDLIGIGRFDNALLAPIVVLSSAQEFSS
jgi:tRNA pseudouridine55 synthase